MSNPFVYGVPVRGDAFVGRTAVLRRVLSRVCAEGQATALVGEPGIGKTSVMSHFPEAAAGSSGSDGETLCFQYVDAHTLPAPASAAASSGQRGRPTGAVDLAPRMPRRVMAATQELLWQPDNPYRVGSASHARYELYKGAETVGEARRRGATPQDIKAGIERAYAQLT